MEGPQPPPPHHLSSHSYYSPAYFAPNYKYFDQLLQTVKNETTVLNLAFKGFLQTSIPPLISIFYAKEDFPLKIFCLTVPKKLVGEPFGVSEIFGYRKISCIRGGKGGYYDSRRKFVVSVLKNFAGKPLCFRKFLVSKNFMDNRGEGVSRFSIETLLSHSTETFRRGTLLCCVSEKFRSQKSLWIKEAAGGGGSITIFRRKSTETFYRGTLLCFRKFPGSISFMDKRRGGSTVFCRIFFSVSVPKYFVEEPCCVSENFCYGKMLGIRDGVYHDFPSQYRKIS